MAESLGLLQVETLAEMTERENKLAEARESVNIPVISSLTGHIQKCWNAAKQAKTPIEQRMIRSLRQRAGIYEPEKLSAIRQMGGSEIYVLLTLTKCRAGESWIKDVLSPAVERPWTIEPTPISDLPPDIAMQIRDEVAAEFQQVMTQYAQMTMVFPDIQEMREPLREYLSSQEDRALEELQEEAQRRSERMALKIEDQLDEGGWHEAFADFIADTITFPCGVLKGPVIRRKKAQQWVQGPQGWTLDVQDALVPEFERVSPFDIYPAPDSRGIDDGFFIERHKLTRNDLTEMIGVPGYNEENIRLALSEHAGVRSEQLGVDSQRAELELGQTYGLLQTDKIEALEFWGSVPGQMLMDWGMEGIADPEMEYEVDAWMVGNYIIRAILNPDKLGRKPYSVTSYEKVPGSIYGRGVPELMADIQDVCNAMARAIVNNAGMASGPQVEVDIERVPGDKDDIWPWKIWQSTNQQMREGNAVKFNQPTVITEPLLSVYQLFSTMADEQTGIPKWTHGDTNVGGAGETSSGLSMLMTSSARGIKQVIGHIDTAVASTITRLYDYNMLYDPDENIKGDAKVVARGSTSLVAKEQRITRTNEFLAATNNPTDLQIIGLEGRAKLLREAAKALEMNVDEIIPSDDRELKQMLEKMQQQMQMQMMQMGGASPIGGSQPGSGAVPQKKPQTLDAAGRPAGGMENNAFMNKKGDNPSGNVGSEPIEKREFGGDVYPGRDYLTGERGPEIFMPDWFTNWTQRHKQKFRPEMVGMDGPQIIKPNVSGTIIPNPASTFGLSGSQGGPLSDQNFVGPPSWAKDVVASITRNDQLGEGTFPIFPEGKSPYSPQNPAPGANWEVGKGGYSWSGVTNTGDLGSNRLQLLGPEGQPAPRPRPAALPQQGQDSGEWWSQKSREFWKKADANLKEF